MVPVLETPRMIMRGHRTGDFAECAAMWADPAIVRHISGTPFTAEASWARILRYSGHWAMLGYGYWALEAKADGRFLGEVGFADNKRAILPDLDGLPEAGWVLKSAEQGQGYAREAISRMLEWADRTAGFARTHCIFDPEHSASITLAERHGYGAPRTATYRDGPILVLTRGRAA